MKLENMQKTGSFKLRGAYYKVSTLNELECARGVIAASAGNHAQGLALSCSLRGIRSKIFMPENAPLSKIEAVKSYGADIVLEGDNYQAAYEAAKREEMVNGGVFVHPFDDYDVIAGQSTVALEMLQQNPELKTIVVPVGGGGLLAGIALAVKSVRPDVKVVGVQSVNASAVYQAFTCTSKKHYHAVLRLRMGSRLLNPERLPFL